LPQLPCGFAAVDTAIDALHTASTGSVEQKKSGKSGVYLKLAVKDSQMATSWSLVFKGFK
jgi:hypothetical protein